MARLDLERMPPVLAALLTPWDRAIGTAGPGMGGHVVAVADNTLSALGHRVVPTPRLERAFRDARAATEALAAALDGATILPFWRRDAARESLGELAVWLRRAEPNAVTKDLGLGW
ncbi:hypothetical protein MKK75_03600 [Methylobacterium sp. J-030]|uniref:hypothetical protein n=1 Tax=Methylobacterium sp. J-030 TaxID=2836627 RepID=UPI001FB949D3|nr:hypothetical protein [Methylobacterium sp. J-030]MCJ2067903.1 hypothetical protein [Methylobacterium sp. J-030]